MILNPLAAAAPAGDALTEDFAGDPCELQEYVTDMLTECHNLVVALARFEHFTLTDGALTEESKLQNTAAAAKEGLEKMGQKVKEFFTKLIEWLKNAALYMYNRVIGPRAEWLKKHEAALNAATDEDLKKINVKLGEHVAAKRFTAMGSDLEKVVANLVQAASANASGVDETEGWRAKIDDLIAKYVGSRQGAGSLASIYKSAQVGPEKDFQLSKALVAHLIQVADDTQKNVEVLKALQTKLGELVSVHVKTTDAASGKVEVDRRMYIGPKVSALVSAFTSANAVVNAQAMAALARAASAGRKAAKPEPEAKPEDKPEAKAEAAQADAKPEDKALAEAAQAEVADLLTRWMPA